MAQFTTEAAAIASLNWLAALAETLVQKGILSVGEVDAITKKAANMPGSDDGKHQSRDVFSHLFPKTLF
jgi:hypothetical protein